MNAFGASRPASPTLGAIPTLGGSPTRPASPTLGAILLAGGRATRLDGEVKPLLDVGGRTLLQHAVDAARAAGAHPITVVAPRLVPELDVEWTREDPPFGGPAAAIVAGLAAWAARGHDPDWMLLLACDLPRACAAAARLMEAILLLPSDTDGVCLGDASSRPQWLTGAYRTAALRRSAASLPRGGRDAPMHALLDDLAIAVLAAPDDIVQDVDTWDDLDRARGEAR
ncbi:molybdenum cofactor guanylyltransferase [Microbacterium sp.]|uniref:molybdenum cofactor guanylyltransferase n=1 Tax=Microbacterium sp. TaxID=51671 RepID=UPI0039E398C9